MSFGMQILLVACWLALLLRYRPHQTFQLQGHLRKEPGVCWVYTGVARVWPFPHRSWKQQSNCRPKLTSPTGWTHVEMLLESHCYGKTTFLSHFGLGGFLITKICFQFRVPTNKNIDGEIPMQLKHISALLIYFKFCWNFGKRVQGLKPSSIWNV